VKIAITAENKHGLDSAVSHHFGRCPYYVFVDVDGLDIQSVQVLENPYKQQHEPGMVPRFIHRLGVDVMLSGGMGRRAISLFKQYEIHIATGATGTVRAALENYLRGELSGAAPCRESVEHADRDS
jgi:predicted Fe-Mo cluster-binding NifX family protein